MNRRRQVGFADVSRRVAARLRRRRDLLVLGAEQPGCEHARQARADVGTNAEHVTAGRPGQRAPEERGGPELERGAVEVVAAALPVGRRDHEVRAAQQLERRGPIGVDVHLVARDLRMRVAFADRVGHGAGLVSPQVAHSAHVPGDVRELQPVGIDQHEAADAGARQVHGDRRAAAAEAYDRNPLLGQRVGLEQAARAGEELGARRYARDIACVDHAAVREETRRVGSRGVRAQHEDEGRAVTIGRGPGELGADALTVRPQVRRVGEEHPARDGDAARPRRRPVEIDVHHRTIVR